MPKRPRPVGLGLYNPTVNDWRNTPLFDDKRKNTTTFFIENPQPQEDAKEYLDMWLLEIGAATFAWTHSQKAVATGVVEPLDEAGSVPLSSLNSVIAEIPAYSMNVPVSAEELEEVRTIMGFPPV